MFLVRLFLSFVVSFLTSLFLVPKFCVLAERFNFFDVPDGKLKKQKQRIPYLGGVAIFCALATSLFATFPFTNNLLPYIAGPILLLFVGLVDDLISLSPGQKFFGQVVASLCFIKSGLFLKEMFFLQPINIIISILWFLTVINAFNLVDVMDGLSSSLALYASAAFSLFLYLSGSADASILFVSLFGSILGFFIYNKPPAKIYMGDAGTLFIGGLIASAPFFTSWTKINCFGLITPILILFIPLLELCSLILIRWHKSIPFYNGSPDHFAIYLKNKGWSSWQVLSFCLAINMAVFLTVLMFYFSTIGLSLVATICLILLFVWNYTVF